MSDVIQSPAAEAISKAAHAYWDEVAAIKDKYNFYPESIDHLTLSEMDKIKSIGGAEMLNALDNLNVAIEEHLPNLMLHEAAASTALTTACLENFTTIFKAMHFYFELRTQQADALFANATPASTGLNS